VNALVAASSEGLGDARCVVDGRSAQSSWLHVASANGAGDGDLDIGVDAAPGADPITEVLSRFSEWRSSHPCPIEPEPNPPPSSAPSSDSSGGCAIAQRGESSAFYWIWLLVLLGRRRGLTALLRG